MRIYFNRLVSLDICSHTRGIRWIKALVVALASAIFVEDCAFAWGPGVHMATAFSILGELGKLLSPAREALQLFPAHFIYGCLAADFFLGKGRADDSRHPHNWKGGFAFLRDSKDKMAESFAYGFLSHLAADVVAHNIYIPYFLSLRGERLRKGHLYAEFVADSLLGTPYIRIARMILAKNLPECDRLIKTATADGGPHLKTHKRIFKGGVRFSDYFLTARRAIIGRPMGLNLISEQAVRFYVAFACDAALDLLLRPDKAYCLRLDPMGAYDSARRKGRGRATGPDVPTAIQRTASFL